MESTNQIAPTQSIQELIAGLRPLLAQPKKSRATDWDQSVARHVALLSIDYPRQTDERLSIEELALLSLAAECGSKEAKRRKIPNRWNAAPPSPCEVLESRAERKAAYAELAKIRAPWCLNFAVSELARKEIAPYRTDIVHWAARNADSLSSCLVAIRKGVESGMPDRPEVVKSLAAFVRSLPLGDIEAGEQFVQQALELVNAFRSSNRDDPRYVTEVSACLTSACVLVTVAMDSQPALALQPTIGHLIESLELGKKTPARLKQARKDLAFRVVAIAGTVSSIASGEDRIDVLRLLQSLASESPTIKEQATGAARARVTFRGILDPIESGSPRTMDLEGVLAALVPEMDDIAARHQGDELVKQARTRVDALAASAGISQMGVAGEECSFDPFRHMLAESKAGMPPRVQIAKPGLLVTRPDGSQRVILKALVVARG